MENSCFKKIRFLGCPESSKSAILDGKQLFVKNQVFGRSRVRKIGCYRWKTAVLTKSAVQEVRRAQNRLFQIENSCFKKIRCLGGPESSKSAILDGKQLFLKKSGVQEVQRAQNRLFQIENSCLYQIRCLEGQRLKSGILDGKQVFFITSGVQEVHRVQYWLFQMENSC